MATVLLLAHPDMATSRVNRAMLAGVEDLPKLEVANIHALYPEGRIDAEAEIERLVGADRLVLQFPLFWYATPPLLKQWEDSVLTPLIYGNPDLAAATAGLPVLAATTTGGPSASYRRDSRIGMTIDDLFAPLRATALRSGWQWQSPFAVHDVRNLDDAALAAAVEDYRSAIVSFSALSKLQTAA